MRLCDEGGFTIMELLIAMTISLLLLDATLTTFNVFLNTSSRLVTTDETMSKTRLGIDRVARQLRNLANPTASGSSIDRALPYDFVFQTSDPTKRRVRYCLASSPGGSNDVIWFQSTSAAGELTPDMTGNCPGTGWSTTSVDTDGIVNRLDGVGRHVFSFGCSRTTPAAQDCTASSSLYQHIVSVRVDLFVDVKGTGDTFDALRMSTGVFLRNQNEPPSAVIAAPTIAGPRTVTLNGSASSDPEGRTLQFQWYAGSATLPAPVCAGGPVDQLTIGQGMTLTHTFDPAAPSPQQIRLRVIDAGCLYAVSLPIPLAIA
jgi:type II secretory pathway pseudopilin PulG